jgi:hypothetical protein
MSKFVVILVFLSIFIIPRNTVVQTYFPPTESEGGWRKNTDPSFILSLGLDPEAVKEFGKYNLAVRSEEISSAIVIKDGWIVGEWYSSEEGKETRLYLSSIGKTFAMICFGIAVKDSSDGALSFSINRDSKVYDQRWLKSGFPLSDHRKKEITFDHIFRHTSGLAPEVSADGQPVEKGRYRWHNYTDWVMGHDNRWLQTSSLCFSPGHPEEYPGSEQWGKHAGAYSTLGYAHIGLVLESLYSIPAHDFLWKRLLGPIGYSGIEFFNPPEPPNIMWFSGGGLKMVPRDLARFAYFVLHLGTWKGTNFLPENWIQSIVSTPFYQNMRSNSDGYFGTQYPRDMYRMFGSGGNFVFVFPSHNMIVIRTSRVNNIFFKILERDFLRRAYKMVSDLNIE